MSIGFFCLVDIAANTMNIIGARYNLRAGERGGQCIYVVSGPVTCPPPPGADPGQRRAILPWGALAPGAIPGGGVPRAR